MKNPDTKTIIVNGTALKISRELVNLRGRMVDTDTFHRGKKTKRLVCKIFKLKEKETRYSPEKLREIRAERGIGSPKKLAA